MPLGSVVEEVIAGRPGVDFGEPFDYRAGYRVIVRATSPPASVAERRSAVAAGATAQGWVESAQVDRPNAVVLSYERKGLHASVSVRKATSDLAVTVQRDDRAVAVRLGLGAIAGGVLAGGAWFAWRRSSRTSSGRQ